MPESESKWSQHVDKIAYGIAGALGIICLVLPFVMGRGIAAKSVTAQQALSQLEGKIAAQRTSGPGAIHDPHSEDALAEQWHVGKPTTSPRWVTQVAPVLVRSIDKRTETPAIHNAPSLHEVACHRDPVQRRVGLWIKGAVGEGNEYIVVKQLELHRQEGDGPFVRVYTQADVGQTFEHIDYDVVPGRQYSYKIVSVAQKDPRAPAHISPPESSRTESVEVGPTPPVPFDLSVRVLGTVPAAGESSPRVMAKIVWWDYEEGVAKEVKKRGRNVFDENEPFADGRFTFFPIVPEAREVSVKFLKEARSREKFTVGQKARPVDVWAPLEGGGAGEAESASAQEEGAENEEEGDQDGDVEAEEAEDEESRPKPRRQRRRSFR